MPPDTPVTPPAQTTATPSLTTSVAESAQNLGGAFDAIMQSGSGVSDILSKVSQSFGSLNSGILSFITNTGSMVGNAEKIKAALASHPAVISGITAALSGAQNSYTNFFASQSGGYGSLAQNQTAAMESNSRLLNSVKSSDILVQLGKIDSGFAKLAANTGTNLTTNAIAAENFLQRLSAGAEKTGRFSQFTESLGPDMAGAPQMLQDRAAQMNQVAQATRLPSAAQEAYVQLMNYRGAIDGIIAANEAATVSNRHLATSLIELSTGAGVSKQAFFQSMDTLQKYSNFKNFEGENAVKAAGFFSSIIQASQLVGVSQETMQTAIDKTAQAFRYQGDNAQSLLGPLTSLSQKLESVGLGAESAVDLSQDFISSLGKMSMADKMRLSEMTGGSGGAAGAFEIESLIRKKGGASEVFNRLQDMVQEQLGQIITLEDVEMGGDVAANARLRQMEALRSTPLGQGKNDDQIAVMLDALSKREIGERDSGLIDPSDALKKLTAQGQMAIARSTGPQTPFELAEMQLSTMAMPAAYAGAQALMGNTEAGMRIKQDAGLKLDTGTLTSGSPRTYQEGLSEEIFRANIDIASNLASVSWDTLKAGANEAGKALLDLVGLLRGRKEPFPSPGTLPVQKVASQAPTTPASTAPTMTPGASGTSVSPAGSIPFFCGECKQTYFGEIHGVLDSVSKAVSGGRVSNGT